MDTEIITEAEIEKCPALIEHAGKVIRDGGLVAFPTETVYGLGGDALNKESSKKIYAAKGRPSDNPLIVHIARLEDIYRLVSSFPKEAQLLAKHFWPGPLTMILNKSDTVPFETTGGLSTVAVRFPVHPLAQRLILESGCYIAAPSANLSGKPSPTAAKYVIEDMDGRIDLIIDGGDVPIGLESTIVDVTGDTPCILRPGYITQEMLNEVLGTVEIDRTILSGDSKERPKAPGMKYRHYAPKGDLTIITGSSNEVIEAINHSVRKLEERGVLTGIIATEKTANQYQGMNVKNAGSREDEATIAHNLFTILREFDDEGTQVIYSESFDTQGIGQAIMNRLLKAAGHQVIEAGQLIKQEDRT